MNVSSAEMPARVRVHVKLANGEEVIVPLWKDASDGKIHVPAGLMFQAVWVYDLEGRAILKNKTGRKLLVPLGVEEVGRAWLVDRKFIRERRPVVPQPTPDLRRTSSFVNTLKV